MTNKLYDLSKLFEISKGNKDFVGEIVSVFVSEAPITLKEMKEALQANDLTRLRKLSHRIRPSISLFGIKLVESDISNIESIATTGVYSVQLENLFSNFETILEKVVKDLQEDVLSIHK